MKKYFKILYTLIACAVMPFVFCACTNDDDGLIKVSKISLDKDAITLVVDGDKSSSDEFTVSFEPANANQIDVEFAQYDKDLIEISQKRNSSDTFVVKAKTLSEESKSTIIVARMKGNVDVSCKIFVEVTRKVLSNLSAPTNIHYNEEYSRIEWDACLQTTEQGFNGYIVDINGEEYVTSPEKNFIALSEDKFSRGVENQVKVKAISQIDDYNSDYSETYNFLVLDDVKNLSHNNGEISWDSVVGATSYQYKVNAQKPITLTKDTLKYTQTFDQKGEYEIEVTALASNKTDENGNVVCYCFGSSSAKVNVTKLSAPENFQYKNLFTWDAVVDADSYEIYEVKDDGTAQLLDTLKNISYKLSRDIAVGAHKYKVRAIGNGKTTITSDFSAVKTVNKLATPTGLRVEDGVITWDKDTNAVTYQISFSGYYDGQKYFDEFYEESKEKNAFFYIDQPDENENKITFKFGEKFKGDYRIRVASVSDAENTVDSNWSDEIYVVKLNAPDKATFGVEDNKIVWQAITNASAYEIVLNVDGEETIEKVYTNSYEVSQDIAKGEFSFQIRSLGNTASGDSYKYLNSDLSTVAYAQKLEAPVLSVENGVLVWNTIKNSSKYILNINSVDYDMGKETKFDFAGLDAKEYIVKVKAVGGNASAIGTNNLIGSFESSYSVLRSLLKYSAPTLLMQDGELKSSTSEDGAVVTLNPVQKNADGSLSVTAYSKGNTTDLESTKGYISSEKSATLTYYKASNPSNLKVENGVLVWDELDSKYQGAYFKMTTKVQSDDETTTTDTTIENNNHSYDFSQSASGQYTITLKIIGTSNGTAGNLVMSSGDSSISFVILPQPELKVTDVQKVLTTQKLDVLPGELYWDTVSVGSSNALGYNLKIQNGNSTQTYDVGSKTSFSVQGDAGTYKVSLQAYGDGEQIINGQYSEPIEFTKLTAPSNIQISSDGVISWDSDYNGNIMGIRVGFYVELNGEKYLPYDVSKFSGTSYIDIGNYIVDTKSVQLNDLYNGNKNNFIQGEYKVRIVTIPLNMTFSTGLFTIGHTNDLISNASELITFTKLEQPYGLKVDRNDDGHYVVNWTRSLNSKVSGYEISIKEAGKEDDEAEVVSISGVNNTSYDFTSEYLLAKGLTSGNYVVKVRTTSTTANIVSSEYGEEVTLKLVSNINLSIKDGKLAWTKIDGATSYNFEFTIAGETFNKILSADTTSYALSLENDERFVAGEYSIKVKVIADSISNYADEVSLDNYEFYDCGTFTKLETPTNLKVTNGKITFNSNDTPDYFNLYMTGASTGTIKLENDVLDTSTKIATYELAEKYGAGTYSFTAQAMGNNNYLSSEISSVISPNEVKKLEVTSLYLKNGILNWNYVENSNGFQVEISGEKFYIYDSNNDAYVEEATGNAFSVKVEGALTTLDISKELSAVNGTKFMLEAGVYSVRVKALGTDITFLNSNFTISYNFTKLKQIQDVKIKDGKLTWGELKTAEAPNSIALYIKFDDESEFRTPITLDGSVNEFDFAGVNYPAKNGYQAYLQLIGDTKLSVTGKELGYVCGTPSAILTGIEKLTSPNKPEIAYEQNTIGKLQLDEHPKASESGFGTDSKKYLLSVTIKTDDAEKTLDDIILSSSEYILNSENLGNVDLGAGVELIFKVKNLGLDSYISSDFSESLTIVIPQSPELNVVCDDKGRFTGKVTWQDVKFGDFKTNYILEYQFLSNDDATNLGIKSLDEITDETWANGAIKSVTETGLQTNVYYVNSKGYYRFRVYSSVVIDANSQITSPEQAYSSAYGYTLFNGGSGDKDNPFVIDSIETFSFIRYNVTAYYKLVNNIDFENGAINNIGSSEEPFTGSFDGQNYVLSNINIYDVAEYSSIFDYVGENGEIKNIIIQNIKITNGTNVGGIVGYNAGTVSKIVIGGVVDSQLSTTEKTVYTYDGASSISPYSSSSSQVACGGVVGYNVGTVTNCDNYAIVAPRNNNQEVRSGGIVGQNEGGTVKYSYNHNNVGGQDQNTIYSNMSGGIVGFNNKGTITNCGNFGNVFAISRNESKMNQGAFAGGITAYNNRGTITACYNDNSNGVYTQDGIQSATQIFAKTTFSTMDIFVGGIVGYNETGSSVQTCYSISNIQYDVGTTSATANLGSIIGLNKAVYMDLGSGLRCYALSESQVESAGETFQTNADVVAYGSQKFSDFVSNVSKKLGITTIGEIKYE